MCPQEANSWCKYQTDKQQNTTTCKYKPGSSAAARELMRPIFMNLSNYELVKKSLHDQTQNNHEFTNNVIWKIYPKNISGGRKVLEITTASVVINLNDRFQGILNFF